MLTKKMSHCLQFNHHLRTILSNSHCTKDLSTYCARNLNEITQRTRLFLANGLTFRMLTYNKRAIVRSLKEQSVDALKMWIHQCECVVAQRVRRGQQMFSLYNRLWEETAFKDLLVRIRQQFVRHSKQIMFSTVGIAVFDWNTNRIPVDEMQTHLNEIDYLKRLRAETFALCHEMGKSKCSEETHYPVETQDGWVLFIRQKELIVWRRLHESGAYEYKVYGSYNDVTAEDFLNVQVDIEYRKKWDTTAVALRLVDEDPNDDVYGDVIYWEMLWPKLFTNRDYVFNRRYIVDCGAKTAVIMSKSTRHPQCPEAHDKYRVNDYWSYMVIKPYTELDETGIEFGLTYFDNPGVNIPSPIVSWVAMKAMPDFLARMRIAAKDYHRFCADTGRQCICIMRSRRDDDVQPKRTMDTFLSGPGMEVMMTSPSPIVQADSRTYTFWQHMHINYFS